MAVISLQHTGEFNPVKIKLPGSKSETNRALILNYLSKGQVKLSNTSEAEDSVQLQKILNNLDNSSTIDCGPAGTSFRFLTSLLAFKKGTWTLTGSDRMKERPIKDLVDALQLLGCKISYLENEGFPPLKIEGIEEPTQTKTKISVEKSSQYLSSLLLVAPFLPKGLEIEATGKGGSKPYIKMTTTLLQQAGIRVDVKENLYSVYTYKPKNFNFAVESDWSGASYWFSFVALNPSISIRLRGLKENSLQGDAVLCDIFEKLGVRATFLKSGVRLQQKGKCTDKLVWDFSDCPDIAQTVFVCCAALGISGEFTGLESLRIKETDRIHAMQQELAQFGVQLKSTDDITFYLSSGKTIEGAMNSIDTYHDHRMAMAFAPMVSKTKNLYIKDPKVVGKSYPNFWEHVAQAGIEVKELD